MGNDAQAPDAAASVDFEQVQSTEQFKELRKRHRSFVIPMAVAFLLWYFAYVSTFAITGWYVSYSNRRLDPIAAEIRNEIEGHEFDKHGNPVGGVNK